jgi:branched-chain amino acid transport system permease protein
LNYEICELFDWNTIEQKMFIQLILNTTLAASIYTLVAVGFSLIYSTTRFFHFAHGAIYTLGPYFTYLFAFRLGLDLKGSICLAIIASMIVGVLTDFVVYRPLRRKGATALLLLLSSLGIYVIFQNMISLSFGDETRSLRSGIVSEGLDFFGARITPVQVMIILASILLLISSWLLLKFTRVGVALRAVASDPELARVSGIDADRTILIAFAIGSGLAAVAAILISLDIDMTPTMGMNALFMGLIAVIIGGVGSIPGAALGGVLLAFAQNFGIWKISSRWQDAIAFIILVLFLFCRPHGFFGKKIKKVEV